MTVALDASALLAFLADEPGADLVASKLDDAVMSTVNWSEVLGVYEARELVVTGRAAAISALGLGLVPFSAWHAELAAGLLAPTRSAGLSLGDRACLALALDGGHAVLTADRAWADLDLGLEIDLIR